MSKFYLEFWLFILVIISALLVRPILFFLLRMNDGTLLYILISVILLLTIFYVYLFKKQPSFVEKHQGFLTIMGIFIPVALSLLQSTVISSDSYFKAEILLKEENNRNIWHLESIKSDLTSDPNVNFWRDFSVFAYRENWPHLQKYYSQDCRDLYVAVIISYDILNNINSLRRSLPIAEAQALTPWQDDRFSNIEKGYTSQMLKNASSTLPLAYRIVSECQQIDQKGRK